MTEYAAWATTYQILQSLETGAGWQKQVNCVSDDS